PAFDLARIQLNDCNSILLPDVGVDVAIDELEFVQPPYSLTGVHSADLRLPLHCVGIQEPQHGCAVTLDELTIVMSESPRGSSVRERGLRLERIEVIPDTGVTVQRTAKRGNKCFEILQRQRVNVRLRSHRSQLDKLPPPLRRLPSI